MAKDGGFEKQGDDIVSETLMLADCAVAEPCTRGLSPAPLAKFLSLSPNSCMQLTDKLVEKVGVQRTPGANPEMYKSDDYSAHLKGDNSVHKKDSTQETLGQKTPDFAGELCLPPHCKSWSIGEDNGHCQIFTTCLASSYSW